MKSAWIAGLSLLLGVTLSGCGRPDTGMPKDMNRAVEATGPQKAQRRLPSVRLWLGTQEISAEIALTRHQIETGMMFRTNIADNEGMLFVFTVPHRASFWMKNVPIPLSCAYIDPEGTILEIHDMHRFDTNPIPATSDRIQFVLETAQGWFERHQVGTGAVVRTEMGSLRETFLGGGRPRR